MAPKANAGEILRSVLKTLLVLSLSLAGSLLIAQLGVGKESIIMVFLLGVLFVPMLTGGYLYGLAASFASVMLFNFFFAEPRYTFLVYSGVDAMLLLFFLVTALVSGSITSRLQKQMGIASRNERTARLLYEVAEGLLHASGKRNIIQRGIRYILDNTGFSSRVFLDGDPQEDWGDGQEKLEAESRIFPIQVAATPMGTLAVYCGAGGLTFQQEMLVKAVATQLATALDREESYQEREEIRIAMERERLRSTLLRAVAHDLRSPLTALTGASALLADKFEQLPPEEQKKLASDISEEMVWLANLVENILNMTRIREGALALKLEEEVIDDIVHQALSHMSRILRGRRLDVSLPGDVVSLPMDGKLVVQVLVNLLDNAVRHTPPNSAIALRAYVRDNWAVFEVDSGGGIDPAIMERLFDGFGDQKYGIVDGKRGMGMGLAICKAVVEAHGGEIRGENLARGGARFTFTLPMEATHAG